MKLTIVLLALMTSLSSFAGDLYLSCGFGEEEHWENFTDSLLGEKNRGMILIKKDTVSYAISFNGMLYRYLKSDSNLGGYEEKTIMPKDLSGMKVAPLVDNIWCHIND